MSALTKDSKDYAVAMLRGTVAGHLEKARAELALAIQGIDEIAKLIEKTMTPKESR